MDHLAMRNSKKSSGNGSNDAMVRGNVGLAVAPPAAAAGQKRNADDLGDGTNGGGNSESISSNSNKLKRTKTLQSQSHNTVPVPNDVLRLSPRTEQKLLARIENRKREQQRQQEQQAATSHPQPPLPKYDNKKLPLKKRRPASVPIDLTSEENTEDPSTFLSSQKNDTTIPAAEKSRVKETVNALASHQNSKSHTFRPAVDTPSGPVSLTEPSMDKEETPSFSAESTPQQQQQKKAEKQGTEEASTEGSRDSQSSKQSANHGQLRQKRTVHKGPEKEGQSGSQKTILVRGASFDPQFCLPGVNPKEVPVLVAGPANATESQKPPSSSSAKGILSGDTPQQVAGEETQLLCHNFAALDVGPNATATRTSGGHQQTAHVPITMCTTQASSREIIDVDAGLNEKRRLGLQGSSSIPTGNEAKADKRTSTGASPMPVSLLVGQRATIPNANASLMKRPGNAVVDKVSVLKRRGSPSPNKVNTSGRPCPTSKTKPSRWDVVASPVVAGPSKPTVPGLTSTTKPPSRWDKATKSTAVSIVEGPTNKSTAHPTKRSSWDIVATFAPPSPALSPMNPDGLFIRGETNVTVASASPSSRPRDDVTNNNTCTTPSVDLSRPEIKAPLRTPLSFIVNTKKKSQTGLRVSKTPVKPSPKGGARQQVQSRPREMQSNIRRLSTRGAIQHLLASPQAPSGAPTSVHGALKDTPAARTTQTRTSAMKPRNLGLVGGGANSFKLPSTTDKCSMSSNESCRPPSSAGASKALEPSCSASDHVAKSAMQQKTALNERTAPNQASVGTKGNNTPPPKSQQATTCTPKKSPMPIAGTEKSNCVLDAKSSPTVAAKESLPALLGGEEPADSSEKSSSQKTSDQPVTAMPPGLDDRQHNGGSTTVDHGDQGDTNGSIVSSSVPIEHRSLLSPENVDTTNKPESASNDRPDELDLLLCHEDFQKLLGLASEVKSLHVYGIAPAQSSDSPLSEVLAQLHEYLLTLSAKKDTRRILRGTNPTIDIQFDDMFAILQTEKHRCEQLLGPKPKPKPRGKEAICVKYPQWQTSILHEWMRAHQDNPYPGQCEVNDLMHQTGLSQQQIINWTTNVRKRNLKASREAKKKPHHFIDFLFLAKQRDAENGVVHQHENGEASHSNGTAAIPLSSSVDTSDEQHQPEHHRDSPVDNDRAQSASQSFPSTLQSTNAKGHTGTPQNNQQEPEDPPPSSAGHAPPNSQPLDRGDSCHLSLAFQQPAPPATRKQRMSLSDLPAGWEPYFDSDQQRCFFVLPSYGVYQWEKPLPLPDGWTQHFHSEYKTLYYVHTASGKSQWYRPLPQTGTNDENKPSLGLLVSKPPTLSPMSTLRKPGQVSMKGKASQQTIAVSFPHLPPTGASLEEQAPSRSVGQLPSPSQPPPTRTSQLSATTLRGKDPPKSNANLNSFTSSPVATNNQPSAISPTKLRKDAAVKNDSISDAKNTRKHGESVECVDDGSSTSFSNFNWTDVTKASRKAKTKRERIDRMKRLLCDLVPTCNVVEGEERPSSIIQRTIEVDSEFFGDLDTSPVAFEDEVLRPFQSTASPCIFEGGFDASLIADELRNQYKLCFVGTKVLVEAFETLCWDWLNLKEAKLKHYDLVNDPWSNCIDINLSSWDGSALEIQRRGVSTGLWIGFERDDSKPEFWESLFGDQESNETLNGVAIWKVGGEEIYTKDELDQCRRDHQGNGVTMTLLAHRTVNIELLDHSQVIGEICTLAEANQPPEEVDNSLENASCQEEAPSSHGLAELAAQALSEGACGNEARGVKQVVTQQPFATSKEPFERIESACSQNVAEEAKLSARGYPDHASDAGRDEAPNTTNVPFSPALSPSATMEGARGDSKAQQVARDQPYPTHLTPGSMQVATDDIEGQLVTIVQNSPTRSPPARMEGASESLEKRIESSALSPADAALEAPMHKQPLAQPTNPDDSTVVAQKGGIAEESEPEGVSERIPGSLSELCALATKERPFVNEPFGVEDEFLEDYSRRKKMEPMIWFDFDPQEALGFQVHTEQSVDGTICRVVTVSHALSAIFSPGFIVAKSQTQGSADCGAIEDIESCSDLKQKCKAARERGQMLRIWFSEDSASMHFSVRCQDRWDGAVEMPSTESTGTHNQTTLSRQESQASACASSEAEDAMANKVPEELFRPPPQGILQPNKYGSGTREGQLSRSVSFSEKNDMFTIESNSNENRDCELYDDIACGSASKMAKGGLNDGKHRTASLSNHQPFGNKRIHHSDNQDEHLAKRQRVPVDGSALEVLPALLLNKRLNEPVGNDRTLLLHYLRAIENPTNDWVWQGTSEAAFRRNVGLDQKKASDKEVLRHVRTTAFKDRFYLVGKRALTQPGQPILPFNGKSQSQSSTLSKEDYFKLTEKGLSMLKEDDLQRRLSTSQEMLEIDRERQGTGPPQASVDLQLPQIDSLWFVTGGRAKFCDRFDRTNSRARCTRTLCEFVHLQPRIGPMVDNPQLKFQRLTGVLYQECSDKQGRRWFTAVYHDQEKNIYYRSEGGPEGRVIRQQEDSIWWYPSRDAALVAVSRVHTIAQLHPHQVKGLATGSAKRSGNGFTHAVPGHYGPSHYGP
ncbi:homeobox and C2H2 transcription factor [Seminavis robusta]|uniref:Homeobox and C2H2 transcription factor n=1 Tax=Seminavis robusta TaxID=568900 RepID=A0A9N8DIB5_9STRA|nr:homeobox and C2H2 transcription factor [Seminavis robusta]|eukprot:Sro158_g071520.1 homeobox and C2H2 transcription factor (2577) ;mRNA; f:30943-38762